MIQPVALEKLDVGYVAGIIQLKKNSGKFIWS
jgi:hypothetical protein